MKMIMAIVQPKDSNRLRDAYDRVDDVLEIIKKNAESREQYMTPPTHMDNGAGAMPINVQVGGATVFVLPVEQFLHF